MVVVFPNIPIDQQTVVRGERDVADGDWYRFWKGEQDAIRELQTAFPVTSGAVNVGFAPPPALTFGGAAVGMTYGANQQVGRAYVLGPIVLFWIYLQLTAKGASVGAAAIGPLPFAASSEIIWTFNARYNNMTAGVGDTVTAAHMAAGGTSIIPTKVAAGVHAQMTDADFANNSQIRINGMYYTTP